MLVHVQELHWLGFGSHCTRGCGYGNTSCKRVNYSFSCIDWCKVGKGSMVFSDAHVIAQKKFCNMHGLHEW